MSTHQKPHHTVPSAIYIAILGLLFAVSCEAGFSRLDSIVDDAVDYCLTDPTTKGTKETCRDVVRRPDGPTPHVIGSVPDDNAADIDPDTKFIDVVFDQPMKHSTTPLEVYLVSTIPDQENLGEVTSVSTSLSMSYARYEWQSDYVLRFYIPWHQMPEGGKIAYRPTTQFRTQRDMPILSSEPLRSFSVASYEGYFSLLATNQYDCYQYSSGVSDWILDKDCSQIYTVNDEDNPINQNGEYEDHDIPLTRRVMNGPNKIGVPFNVTLTNGSTYPIQAVTTQDATTSLTWASCSMPSKTNYRPPRFDNTGFNDKEPCIDNPGLYSWSDAMAVCGLLNEANSGSGYAGETNWRLPRFDELVTLTDYGVYTGIDLTASGESAALLFNPHNLSAEHKRYFPYKLKEDNYWTSTIVKRPPMPPVTNSDWSFEAYTVSFADGNYGALSPISPTDKAYVLCVSGDTPARLPRSFVDNADGTVSDAHHGLMWQQCVDGQTTTTSPCDTGTPVSKKFTAVNNVDGALNYCESINTPGFAGHTDWRLPNINELRSLFTKTVDNGLYFDQTAFPNSPGSALLPTKSPLYLSSTTNVSYNENPPSLTTFFPQAWTINFSLDSVSNGLLGGGLLSFRDKKQNPGTNGPFARCVRSLP